MTVIVKILSSGSLLNLYRVKFNLYISFTFVFTFTRVSVCVCMYITFLSVNTESHYGYHLSTESVSGVLEMLVDFCCKSKILKINSI